MTNYQTRLLNLSIGLLILIGIPFMFHPLCFLFSWLPAFAAVIYLDEEIRKELM